MSGWEGDSCRGRQTEVESMAKLRYIKNLNSPPLSMSGLHTVKGGFVCLHANRIGSLKRDRDISCWKE